MPIYEYQCPECRRIFEEWAKTTDDCGVKPCPKCGASSSRIMSQTSFVLKGNGWYVSDYGYRKGVKEEDGAPPPGDNQAAASDASPDTSSGKASPDTSPDTSKGTSEPVMPKVSAAQEKPAPAPKPVESAPEKTAPAS